MRAIRLSHVLCVTVGVLLGAGVTVTAANISGSSVFRDVPAGSYYDNAIGVMFQKGIIKGYADGRFGPDEYVTRGQLAVMFERLRADLTGEVIESSSSSRRSRSTKSTSSSEESSSSVSSASSSSSSSSIASNTLNPYGTIRFTSPVFTVNEKEATATISVVRTGGNQGTVTVEYALEAGTATADDFEVATAVLTFQGKATSTTFTIKLKNDALTEGTEALKIVLRTPTNNASIGTPSTAELKIIDDETVVTSSATTGASSSSAAPAVGFGASEYSIADAGGTLNIALVRTGGTTGAVTVQYATADGTAKSSSDYTSTSGTVSFAAGEATKSFPVVVAANSSIGGNKNFKIVLSNPTGGVTVSPGSATVVVYDDEVAAFGTGSLKFSKSSYDGYESQGKVEIMVQRTGGARGKVAVTYSTSNGTATASKDYSAVSGTLTFEDGESVKSFFIPIIYDAESDGEETVNLFLGTPTSGAQLITPSNATLRIY
jgi:hypothetical protein